MDDLNGAAIIFDPNTLMATNHLVFLFSCWASLDPSQPAKILSQFKVEKISHHKMLESPEHEFLVIKTVDASDKPYQFILERRPSPSETAPAVDPPSYREKLVTKLKKLVQTLTNMILSDESFAFDSLSIGDKATLSCIQTADFMSDSLEMDKSISDLTAVDRFLGQNSLNLSRYQGQIVDHFKPHELSLFNFVLLSHVVHVMHPTYTILNHQCFFYARLIYIATKTIFGISFSQSADDSEVEITGPFKYGRWKGVLVNIVDRATVAQVEAAYTVAHRDQLAKVSSFIYL